jgi:hypothetical protein
LSSGWSKQTVLNELVHFHNFWSFSFTSENQNGHDDGEIPEVDETAFLE